MPTKKLTKKASIAFLRAKIASDARWATRALLAIYSRQTLAERAAEATIEANGVGFSGTDAEFLTSLANQFLQKGSLSLKQLAILHRIMPRYAGQLLGLCDPAKLVAAARPE